MNTNQLEVEVNGNKIMITLTDEQIKQLQTPKHEKTEWYDEIKYEQYESGDGKYEPIRYSHRGYSVVPIFNNPIFTNDKESCYCLNANLLRFGSNPDKAYIFNSFAQAKMTIEYINLFIEMYNFCQLRNRGNEIDWTDSYQHKFGVIYNSCMDKFKCLSVDGYSTSNPFVFSLALLSRKHAEEMLSIFGDRIKEVYSKLQNY